jgi:hypothetical protein
LCASEALTRYIDGYSLGSLRLEARIDRLREANPNRGPSSHKLQVATGAWPYVEQLPTAAGVDRKWFLEQLPDRALPQPDADLAARARRYPGVPLEANYEWNSQSVVHALCRGYNEYENTFNQLEDLYVFDPIDGSEWPTFRFLRGASYPSGLRTNVFGWRGPDLPLNKPPNAIRIAFVGASTTVSPHAEPYSYPEIVGAWLGRWVEARHPDLSIEAINAGREGVNSRSIQAIVRQEVIPADPDLIVYYEGSNQFRLSDFLPWPKGTRAKGAVRAGVGAYSSVGRRVETLLKLITAPGIEPVKPTLPVQWPSDLNEQDPDLAYPGLPLQLPRILADLETIRQTSEAHGVGLVMTSFEWLAYPGMVLDPQRDAFLFEYLNTKYWPYSYAHMRRFQDFQNRVYRKFADEHRLDFIDVAGQMPADPRLFNDAIHMTRAGIYMHSWVVFNGLVAVLERRIASRELPRRPREPLPSHPAFASRRKVALKDIRAACPPVTH